MRRLFIVLLSLTLSLVVLLTLGAPVMAAKPNKNPVDKVKVGLPFEETGVHAGAAYKIQVPANWNGTLIVYAHGLYFDFTLGHLDIVIPDPLNAPGSHGGISINQTLLNMGYALAGSSYSAAGWAVKEGIQDTIALITYFNGRVRKPDRTILWGLSMGGTIGLDIVEKHAGLIDGFVCESSNGMPSAKMFDSFLNLRIAYDVLFGWPEELGRPGDLRDELTFYDVFAPDSTVRQDLHGWMGTGNTTDQGKAEMFRLLCFGQDFDTFYGVAPGTSPGWALLMWFTTIVGVDFEKKAGGNPFQNADLKDFTFDKISPDDLDDLYDLLGEEQAKAFLDKMNDTEIIAERSARNWLEHYDTPTGKLKNPVIQLHSVFDPLNFAAGTAIYKETVENAGKEGLLLQVYTGEAFPGYPTGHGFFNPMQYLQVLKAMESWLDTGEKPDPLDPAGYFAPGYGFIPGFIPPPWPF